MNWYLQGCILCVFTRSPSDWLPCQTRKKSLRAADGALLLEKAKHCVTNQQMEIRFCVWIGECCKTPKNWLDLSIELWNVCCQAVAKFSYINKLLPKLSSPQPPPAVVCFFEASVLFSLENAIFFLLHSNAFWAILVILSRTYARFGVLLQAKIIR